MNPMRRLTLGTALCAAIFFANCFGGQRKGECGMNTSMDAQMEQAKARQSPVKYPAYRSFAVQEYAQTGVIRLIAVQRDPGTGGLATREFVEGQKHGGEFEAYNPVAWNEPVPVTAALHGASAGNQNDFYKTFWTMWQDGDSWKALALTQENPVSAPILPGDRAIHAPVQYLDKKLRIFFWRPTSKGWSLYNHVFSGEPGRPGTVATEKLLDVPYEPVLGQADPIAMKWIRKQGFEDAGLAVIGWLSREGDGMKAHAAWLDGKNVRVADSDPIAGYVPYPDQRLGLWCDPLGAVHMAWVMGRTDADTVRVAEWTARQSHVNEDDKNQDFKNLRIRETSYPKKNMRAAACIVRRSQEDSSALCYFATTTGNLYLDEGGRLRKQRSGLPADYDFPIFSSALGTWEARYDASGAIYFASPY